MIRVGIIGCGKVADSHVSQIRRIEDARIVAACDREELMAAQLAERWSIPGVYADAAEMLAKEKLDVVHVTSSPASHFDLGKLCVEAGCSVYMEKPFTLTAGEAERLVDLAETRRTRLTVGHNYQFTPVGVELRRLVRSGALGGDPVHMESTYCYEFSDERYARSLLGDRSHWVRSLPGGLLQNIISHGIGKIVEFLPDEQVEVVARGSSSAFLRSLGEESIVDELRVIVNGSRGTTAYFTFSSQFAPPLHQFRVYGRRASVAVDYLHETLHRLPRNEKSYLNQVVAPFREAHDLAADGRRNLRRLFTKELHALSGVYTLTRLFYRSVTEGAPVPIPYGDIVRTAQIMDDVFAQVSRVSAGTRREP
jgi:predicted dehydrogenase